MARTVASLPSGSRIADCISLGVVAKFFAVEEVHDALNRAKRASVRERDLPWLGCFCLGMVLLKEGCQVKEASRENR